MKVSGIFNLKRVGIILPVFLYFLYSSAGEVRAASRDAGYSANHSSPIALSADQKLIWAVNRDANEVSVVSTSTFAIVKTIPVGKVPWNIALSRDGRYAFVTNAGDGTVSFIRIKNSDPGSFSAELDKSIKGGGNLITGAEPRGMVTTPDGKFLFVANSSQNTISIFDLSAARLISSYSIDKSSCNEPDKSRNFQPSALSITPGGKYLYATRFLSFTTVGGQQASDVGKEGVVCRLTIRPDETGDKILGDPLQIRLIPRDSGFKDSAGTERLAFPNQLQSIVIRGNTAYIPNIAASPSAPLYYATATQAFVNMIDGTEAEPTDVGALNLHLGARVPEKNKLQLYFSNPNSIEFTTSKGEGYAYVVSGGSDLLVKLRVDSDGRLSFTENENTTRYIDLNDPDSAATEGRNAGKNPIGLVIDSAGRFAYALNYVSRNISVIDLNVDKVSAVIPLKKLPPPGSEDEKILVGAELFFSSRGNFVNPSGIGNSRNRMSEKGRQSCASCHADGLTDGVVWHFATGPRKTIPVNGTFNPRDPADQRIINASAIFDELEDADFNTRQVSSGGLLKDPRPCIPTKDAPGVTESRIDPDHGLVLGEFHEFSKAACVMNQFLVPNANRPQATVLLPGSNVEVGGLDALKEWQHYGIRTPSAPMTDAQLKSDSGRHIDATQKRSIEAGRKLFKEYRCDICHAGGKWTTSSKNFSSPPNIDEIASEPASTGANQYSFLYRYLRDIGSFNLNVPNSGNLISGFPAIGGSETDTAGLKALGHDYAGNGKGEGYNIPSLLGIFNLPPYYHNGACETLRCVISDDNHRAAGLAYKEKISDESENSIFQFLKSIDAKTVPF